MHLSQYVLSAIFLSTGVNAFYPYVRHSSAPSSLTSRLISRFFPYRLEGSASDDDHNELLTLPLKKRQSLV